MAGFHKYVVSMSKSGGKFWEVEVEGRVMRTRYGKVGQKKRWSSKTWPTPEKALAEGQKKLAAKMKKGYAEELVTWDLASRIEGMFAALEAHKELEVLIAKRGAPLEDDELAEVEASLGFALDPRFLNFFRINNGLRLVWVYHDAFKEQTEPCARFRYCADEHHPAGSINIPTLAKLFADPGYMFGVDFQEPDEYSERALGGWDAYALRSAMRDVDDFQYLPNDYSYYLPALIAHERYPDPPVLMTQDAVADVSSFHPILARHYIELVIATMGHMRLRLRATGGGGYGSNYHIVAPKEGWLDGFPSVEEMIQFFTWKLPSQKSQFIYDTIDNVSGLPIDPDYLHYNDPPPASARKPSEDPMEGMKERRRDDGGHPFPDGFEGDAMIVPLHDVVHYAITEPLKPITAEAVQALLGQPVKVEAPLMGEIVGALVVATDEHVVLYTESEVSYGTQSRSLGDVVSIGRAWRLIDA